MASSTGYIGSDNKDISTKMSSKSMGTEDNVWSATHIFSQLSTACQVVTASTSITTIPNVIIVNAGNITLTFPSTIPTGTIIHIRRLATGTTTFSGTTFYTTANATMTTSTAINISFASYNNNLYMLI